MKTFFNMKFFWIIIGGLVLLSILPVWSIFDNVLFSIEVCQHKIEGIQASYEFIPKWIFIPISPTTWIGVGLVIFGWIKLQKNTKTENDSKSQRQLYKSQIIIAIVLIGLTAGILASSVNFCFYDSSSIEISDDVNTVYSKLIVEEQINPTSKDSILVKILAKEGNQNNNYVLDIEFLNPKTNQIQEHIDYRLTVKSGDAITFGPIPLTHTATGQVRIPVDFVLDSKITATIEVQGILFQPIEPEFVIFALNAENKNIPSIVNHKFQQLCESEKGLWIESDNECANMSWLSCSLNGGIFNECGPTCSSTELSQQARMLCSVDACTPVCKFQ